MKKFIYILGIILASFFMISEVNAEICPTTSVNTSKWNFTETLNNNNHAYSDMENKSQKLVCCETGASDTKKYYCDKYDINSNYVEPSTDTEGGSTNSNYTKTDKACNSYSGLEANWKFEKCVYYNGVAPESKEIKGVEKIFCQSKGSASTGTQHFECDYFSWEGTYDFSTKPAGAGSKPYGACGTVGSEWKFNYSKSYATDVATETSKIKICCNKAGYAEGTTYLCDVYVAADYYDSTNGTTNNPDRDYVSGCDMLGGEGSDTLKLINKLYGYFTWIIPLLVVVLSILDFVKVVGTGDDKDLKKAQSNLAKRVIVGIVFFIVPVIVSLFINLTGITENFTAGDSILETITCILK